MGSIDTIHPYNDSITSSFRSNGEIYIPNNHTYNEDSRLRTIYEEGYKKGFEDAKKFYNPTTK